MLADVFHKGKYSVPVNFIYTSMTYPILKSAVNCVRMHANDVQVYDCTHMEDITVGVNGINTNLRKLITEQY